MNISPALAIAAITLSFDASANLVANGSFETFTGTFGGDGGAQLISTSATSTGWSVGTAQEFAILETPNVYNLTASEGVNFLDLAGCSNTGFPKGAAQTITSLTTGANYAFPMDLGIHNGACVSGGDNCHGPVQASAIIGGTSHRFTENSSADGNVRTSFGFEFVATSSTMNLTIAGVSLPQGNAFIGFDNVSIVVAPVPVPAARWPLGPGMAGTPVRTSYRPTYVTITLPLPLRWATGQCDRSPGRDERGRSASMLTAPCGGESAYGFTMHPETGSISKLPSDTAKGCWPGAPSGAASCPTLNPSRKPNGWFAGRRIAHFVCYSAPSQCVGIMHRGSMFRVRRAQPMHWRVTDELRDRVESPTTQVPRQRND
ncbi:MAG: hypothetical protein HY749_22355 [Gammaproteobacteria bacterium]|nr:hypothetical protein [Gammaproteobacteria bacterium]MBI5616078.1 hypothetical protein [Gammaproteobacteria bacterium]